MVSLDIYKVDDDPKDERAMSFLLMDEKENLQLESGEDFCKKLGVAADAKIKVVSVFGNTGDGKSHTLNHAFFNGHEIFKTSAEQSSCTMGIWAAFNPNNNVICLDTEGLLGETGNKYRQTRMLLKVLAISDIIVYRTRSERLRTDMYEFLGMASKAFTKYFSTALHKLALSSSPQSLGPAVIIFHETLNTEVLKEDDEGRKEEDIIRERFGRSKLELTAYSSLRYVGIKTSQPPTNFDSLRNALICELRNTTVRSPRQPTLVFEALNALNAKFNGELSSASNHIFPEQYFTCMTKCKSCKIRCQLSMGHLDYKEDHKCASTCKYQHQFENKVYLCNKCYVNGRQVVVDIKTQTNNDSSWLGLAKYAWSGSVIECPYCGEIYRSRQHWYGNKPPEQTSVRPEIVHIWSDGGLQTRGPTHSAQLVLDSVTYITDTLASFGEQPTKSIKSWMTDKIRPTYWRPDSEIIHCKSCICNFERLELKKHHCRNCGEGFCNACSKHKMPVIGRGWDYPVRVCNGCRDELMKLQRSNGTTEIVNPRVTSCNTEPDTTSSAGSNINNNNNNGATTGDAEADVIARKLAEAVCNTFSKIGAVVEYPKDFIKESARPSYWVPDSEAPHCHSCKLVFGCPEELNGKQTVQQRSVTGNTTPASPQSPSQSSFLAIDRRRHHCRACGNAVCAECSKHQRPVPERGWLNEVRVCDKCFSNSN
ncbi:zinc finger FYVE domain-containing protein 1-like isoform X2 [Wyeomyia smithii]|nr:zinc finger FYVE domain-containing protein 1-like isoform X2 [Wyeomyia smithii]XP_055544255.1 zinc finger FYVE domain-containing protein 1-like isoform X2 [Wyeomyia smithii]XP_055544256.1 zinc finger FYVE domain-containing protein 1-like isoform X2 [Wyeomyia smithii]